MTAVENMVVLNASPEFISVQTFMI